MKIYHASNHKFQPGEIVDPSFSKKGAAYASTDRDFALFAASERYKFRNRNTLSDGRVLAADEPQVPIYLYEVIQVDPTEDTRSTKPNREHVRVSTVGFVIIREVDPKDPKDPKDPQLLTFDEIIQGPQPQPRRERHDIERIEKVDGKELTWPIIVLISVEVAVVAAIAAFITYWCCL